MEMWKKYLERIMDKKGIHYYLTQEYIMLNRANLLDDKTVFMYAMLASLVVFSRTALKNMKK